MSLLIYHMTEKIIITLVLVYPVVQITGKYHIEQ